MRIASLAFDDLLNYVRRDQSLAREGRLALVVHHWLVQGGGVEAVGGSYEVFLQVIVICASRLEPSRTGGSRVVLRHEGYELAVDAEEQWCYWLERDVFEKAVYDRAHSLV